MSPHAMLSNTVFHDFNRGPGRADAVFKSHIVSLCAVSSFGVVLVWLYGAQGAAWGLVAGNTFASGYRIFVYRCEICSAGTIDEKQ